MPTYCVAFNCYNSAKKGSGVHFFSFPKDESLKSVWIQKIRRTNFQWSEHSRLCSAHFEPSAYAKDVEAMARYGYKNAKVALKPDAVPTIFDYSTDRRRPASDTSSVPSTPPTPRGAFLKRRKAEVLQQLIAEHETDNVQSFGEDIAPNETSTRSVAVGPDDIQRVTKQTQVAFKAPKKPLPSQRTKREQTPRWAENHKEVQCDDLLPAPPLKLLGTATEETDKTSTPMAYSDDESDIDSDGLEDDADSDSDFAPDSSEFDDSDLDSDNEQLHETEIDGERRPVDQLKFMVFESSIYQLLSVCRTCCTQCKVVIRQMKGTMVVFSATCAFGHVFTWSSQPSHDQLPLGNLLTAAAVFYSGSSASQVLTLLDHLNMPRISLSAFHRIQRSYLIPAVVMTWEVYQNATKAVINESLTPRVLGGDGRCDSPGHSAKYCSYSIMDLATNQILDIQMIQSNEVKSSVHMELEGLKRGLQSVKEKGYSVSTLITDRHVQVKKYMKEDQPQIKHLFDVWHVAKGVAKKLEAASKRKDCSEIHDWVKSITNHTYWVAASSGDDEELKKEKWLSITSHIANVHQWEGDKFTACEHGPVEDRSWMKEGSKPYKLVKDIVSKTVLVKDVKKLSPLYQTYGLEVFHSVLNHFVPKSTHFFYPSMTARTLVAALHFNENSTKTQAVTRDGNERWTVCYPKKKKGQEAVVKPVMEQPTFYYVQSLLSATVSMRERYPSYPVANAYLKNLIPVAPPPLTSAFKKYDKADLVNHRTSRYAMQ